MKMNQNHNLFSFLSRGVTTTHPWSSVFILCICFVFCSYNVSVSASQSNIPEMSDWQFSQALDAYADLTDDQKDIANFLVGSQGYAFAGIAQSNLNSNFSSYSDAVNYVKNFGSKMWNEFNTHVDGVVQNGRNNLLAVKNDLSNFFGNAASYAKSRSESFSAWLGNVGIDYNSSSEFRIQFGKDQAQNNVDYFGDQGLYNWQNSTHLYSPDDFQTWSDGPPILSGNETQIYYSYLNNMTPPLVHGITTSNYYHHFVYGSSSFLNVCNIFINTTTHTVYLCNNEGVQASNFTADLLYVENNSVRFGAYRSIRPQVLSFDSYGSINALFTAINNDPSLIIQNDFSNAITKLNLSDFVTGLYVGSSWSNKAPWTSDTDLNLSSTSQYVTINAPTNIIYLDLNGFMRDLYDNPTIIYNYVVNNSVGGNGDPVDPSGFEPVSKFPGIPDSGITIGTEFFKINGLNPLFGSGGYIDALWNNTKGLVLYIGDILEVLTLDSIDGGGFAWVIYGAVSMGVIGGIFSKFLL